MTRHFFSLAAAFGALAAFAGCEASSQAPRDSAKYTMENTDRFAALDTATEAAVSCTGLQERTLGDGRLEVIANVRNLGSSPARVAIQCVFLDAMGMPGEPEGAWQHVALAGDATEVVRFTAPDARSKRYSIRARKVG
ncbi:MAG TPA: YcfL family protein [Opitutaceae bacterium]|jgi:hypothetical protein